MSKDTYNLGAILWQFDSSTASTDEPKIDIYHAAATAMQGINPMFYDENFLVNALYEFHYVYEMCYNTTSESPRQLALDMLAHQNFIMKLIEDGTLDEFKEIYGDAEYNFFTDDRLQQLYYYNGLNDLKHIARILDRIINTIEVVKKIFKNFSKG